MKKLMVVSLIIVFLVSGCASVQKSIGFGGYEKSEEDGARDVYNDKFYEIYRSDISNLKVYIGKSRDELAEVFSIGGKSMAGDEILDVNGNGRTVYTPIFMFASSDERLIFYLKNYKVYNVIKQ